MSGRHLQKSPDSLCVVNIIPPRELWEVIQPLRNKYTANARCGPHITFIDPFVLSHEYTEARQILEDAFASLEPFEPIAPEGAFDRLIELAAQAFPQCRDQLDRGNGKWVPHLSIGNFKDHNELVKVMTELQNNWKPLRFTLKEVYLLNRPGPDPFEVRGAAHLGSDRSAPHFGPGSDISDPKLSKTLVVANLPKKASNDSIVQGFESIGIKVDSSNVEITLNPDRSMRNIAVIEFPTRDLMLAAVDAVKFSPPFPGIPTFARPLELMAFPDVVNGCATLH